MLVFPHLKTKLLQMNKGVTVLSKKNCSGAAVGSRNTMLYHLC